MPREMNNEKLGIRYDLIADYVHIGFGYVSMWILYAQVCVLVRVSYLTLRNFSFLPFLVFSLLLWFLKKSDTPRNTFTPKEGESNEIPALLWLAIVAAFVITFIYWIAGSQWLFWLMAVAYFLVISFSLSSTVKRQECHYEARITFSELIIVTVVCLLTVFITLGTNRPSADDAYFVNVAVSAIDNPQRPLFTFDGMHKSEFPPVVQNLHLLQVYELFVALLSDITAIPVRTMYYVVLAALWTFFAFFVHWLVLRNFLSCIPALVGLIIVIAILIMWGDGHRTFGNFAFVKLFQGKGIYLFVVLPLIIHGAFRYRLNPDHRNWLCLMLLQCAAAGFTTSALIVAPVAAFFVLISKPRLTTSFFSQIVSGLAATAPLFLLATGMYWRLASYRVPPEVSPALTGYEIVLGSNRISLVFFSLLVLPALVYMVKIRYADWISNYLLIVFFFLFCPVTADFFAKSFAHNFSWRIFWSFPIPLFLGLTIGVMANSRGQYRRFWVVLSLCWLIIFSLIGSYAVTKRNWAWSHIGSYKVAQTQFDVAQRVMEIASKENLALVPESIAVYLSAFHKAPPLIGVRTLYLKRLRGVVSEKELIRRVNLLQYIGGRENELSAQEVWRSIDERNIKTVVFPETHVDASSLRYLLKSVSGFEITRYATYIIATKSS